MLRSTPWMRQPKRQYEQRNLNNYNYREYTSKMPPIVNMEGFSKAVFRSLRSLGVRDGNFVLSSDGTRQERKVARKIYVRVLETLLSGQNVAKPIWDAAYRQEMMQD